MYKDFYEKEIQKISKILERENIYIVETWTHFEKNIYSISDERNVCTDLVLTLDQNPKYMKVIDLEEIENCMKSNPIKPSFFSLQYKEYKDDGLLKECIDFNFYEHDPENPLVSMKVKYKKTGDYDDLNIEIDKDNAPYSKNIMTYVNNKIEDLENEFNVDLSSEKFDLTYKEKILRGSWSQTYFSGIFGEYTIEFKIYSENSKFIIEIENSLTDKIYKIEDGFSCYDEAIDCIRHIKENLIPLNIEDLLERLQ